MERLILDRIDLNILATLVRDCRIFYSSIGSQSGLTSKSVKTRVKNMIRTGIIEKFVVRVNPGLGISEKTTTRRLDSMKEGRLLEFSVQCDPASMIGYVQFTLLINVERTHYREVYMRMYREFQENILYRPSIIDPDDLLIFVLFGENVFMIDSILARVESFEGVKNVDVYILTKIGYHNDWILREIDERLLLQRPPSKKSIKAAATSFVLGVACATDLACIVPNF